MSTTATTAPATPVEDPFPEDWDALPQWPSHDDHVKMLRADLLAKKAVEPIDCTFFEAWITVQAYCFSMDSAYFNHHGQFTTCPYCGLDPSNGTNLVYVYRDEEGALQWDHILMHCVVHHGVVLSEDFCRRMLAARSSPCVKQFWRTQVESLER